MVICSSRDIAVHKMSSDSESTDSATRSESSSSSSDESTASESTKLEKKSPEKKSTIKKSAGKKRALAESHPECQRCTQAKAQKTGTPARWIQHVAEFIKAHPELPEGEARIRARKEYIPSNGRKKSFERIYKEAWKARHPAEMLKNLTKEELDEKIRQDFLKRDF